MFGLLGSFLAHVRTQFSERFLQARAAVAEFFDSPGAMEYLTGLSYRLRGFGDVMTFGLTEMANGALGVEPLSASNPDFQQGQIAGYLANVPFVARALEKGITYLAFKTTPDGIAILGSGSKTALQNMQYLGMIPSAIGNTFRMSFVLRPAQFAQFMDEHAAYSRSIGSKPIGVYLEPTASSSFAVLHEGATSRIVAVAKLGTSKVPAGSFRGHPTKVAYDLKGIASAEPGRGPILLEQILRSVSNQEGILVVPAHQADDFWAREAVKWGATRLTQNGRPGAYFFPGQSSGRTSLPTASGVPFPDDF